MVTLQLPNSVHQQAKALAEKDGVSLDQFIATTVAEKVAALLTLDYLAERAKHDDRSAFEAILAKVSDVEPEEYDRL